MKKILLLLAVVMLVGCSSNTERVTALAEAETLKAQITQKDDYIDDLEHQIKVQNELVDSLQTSHDALKADINQTEVAAATYLCDVQMEAMKYESVNSAISILNGWFALQPQVRLIQGTYSTTFWDGINSRIHTIRYISEDNGLTTTDSFMVFFDEARWKEGVLWLTKQCWVDSPHWDSE